MDKATLIAEYKAGRRDFSGAYLRGADLRGADLSGADLSDADLSGAYLKDADLRGADLRGAYLKGADLRGAYLKDAYLRGADLSGAYLRGADLRGANLRGANLRGADLRGANLSGADLRGANLSGADLPRFQIPGGAIQGWKKLDCGLVAELTIPWDAKRTASLVGRKCRAEYAYVAAIHDSGGRLVAEGVSQHSFLRYAAGETVYPDKYDDDIRVECTHGIHFFLTREEAEEY